MLIEMTIKGLMVDPITNMPIVILKDKDGELYGTFSATHYDPLVTKRHSAYFAALQHAAPPLRPGRPAERMNERALRINGRMNECVNE